MQYFLVGIVFCFLILPGVIIGLTLLRRSLGLFEALIIGCALGLVFMLDINALLSGIYTINRFSLYLGTIVAIGITSIAARYIPRFPYVQQKRGWSWWIIIISIGGAVLRMLPLTISSYPRGWDPGFHLLIAKSILNTGKTPETWMPFEKFPLNYPWGTHALLADLSIITGQPLHQVFAVLMTLIFGALTIGAIYALASSLGLSLEQRLGAAFAYAFISNLGSIDYYGWGGLPNQAGMFLLLCAMTIMLTKSMSSTWRLVLSGYILSGVVLFHHHSMLTAFGVIIFISLYAMLTKTDTGIRFGEAMSVIMLSLLFSSFYSWKLVARLFSVNATGVLRFQETVDIFPKSIYDLGIVLVVCAVIGVVLNWKKRENNLSFVHGWILSLFIAFICSHYVWQFISKMRYGESFVAFTPSRFITDMSYPLSLYAGLVLFVLFKQSHRWQGRGIRILVISALVALGVNYVWAQMYPLILDDEITAMHWIKETTDKNALIINNSASNAHWIPYIADREVTQTPIPVSEPKDDYSLFKEFDLTEYVMGREDVAKRLKAKDVLKSRDVYLYSNKEIQFPQLVKKFEQGNVIIYRVESSMLP